MNTKVALTSLALSGIFMLSGCSLNDIGNSEADTSWLPTTVAEEMTATDAPTPEISAEISDEAFAKAFTKYIETNPVEFGKQVDKAYQIYQQKLKEDQAKEGQEKAKKVPDVSEKDHVKGSADSEFILYEYSDYHCPYCKKFHPTTTQFLKNNPDVALVFRAYPAVHKQTSGVLHEIAECVATEDSNESFWKFTDLAFESGERLTVKNAEEEMKKLGINNTDKIMKCFTDGTFKSVVSDSEKEAQSLGIQGTPGSILKNMKTGEIRVISGAYPLEALENFKKELSQ